MFAAIRLASSRVSSAVQTAAENARFPRWDEAHNSYVNQHLPSGIAILREATGRLVLFINGQRVNVRRGQAQLTLLAISSIT